MSRDTAVILPKQRVAAKAVMTCGSSASASQAEERLVGQWLSNLFMQLVLKLAVKPEKTVSHSSHEDKEEPSPPRLRNGT